MNMKTLRYLLWALVAVAFSGTVIFMFREQEAPELDAGKVFIGGAFAMTDQNGKSVTEKNYAGKAKAMFFGFTYCPDICPTTLARMANLMQLLGTDADKLQVILISVDPERDTPAVLKPYVEAFDARFVGLTGTPEQLAAFAKGYRFFYEKVPTSNGDYTMDHSAGVFLYDANGQFKSTLDPHEKDDVVLKKLRLLIDG
jgi:protein SCO1